MSLHLQPWKVLIIDDNREAHATARTALANVHFAKKPIEIHSAYSFAEGKILLEQMPDVAVILLDLVLENDCAGLNLVDYIREELGNRWTRVILRTNQRGHALLANVAAHHAINDYREKNTQSSKNLLTIVIMALRAYAELVASSDNLDAISHHEDLPQGSVLGFLSLFESADQQWLLAMGQEKHLLAAQTLCHAGEPVTNIYVVLEGLLHLYHKYPDGDEASDFTVNLGPDNIVGDTAWLADHPFAYTVIAAESTLVLAWPLTKLEQRLGRDAVFAATFYRSLAKNCASQLCLLETMHNAAVHRKRQMFSPTHVSELDRRLRELKAAFTRADKQAIQNGTISADKAMQIQTNFHAFCVYLNDLVGPQAELEPQLIEEIGKNVQYELLPLIILAETADRFYAKPRGYAGDYLSIAKIYANKPSGVGRLGTLIDACWLAEPAAQAVRNRRPMMRQFIETTFHGASKPVHITSMACGPAAEVFDVFEQLLEPSALHCHLIDIDPQALSYVGNIRDQRGLCKQIHLHNNNLIYLATGRKKLAIPPQHLIYSVGLIDYFSDKFVIVLINYAFDQLRPGGRLILGNFHPSNPTRAIMDHVLEWRLIHRTEDQLSQLFLSSKFEKPADAIHFEPMGVNLFAECAKPQTQLSGGH